MSLRMGGDRIVLVMHTTAYGAEAFVEASRRVGVEVVIASDRCPVLDLGWQWPADAWGGDFIDPRARGRRPVRPCGRSSRSAGKGRRWSRRWRRGASVCRATIRGR